MAYKKKKLSHIVFLNGTLLCKQKYLKKDPVSEKKKL